MNYIRDKPIIIYLSIFRLAQAEMEKAYHATYFPKHLVAYVSVIPTDEIEVLVLPLDPLIVVSNRK